MVQSSQGILNSKYPLKAIKENVHRLCIALCFFFDPHLRVRLFEKIPAGRKNCRHNAD